MIRNLIRKGTITFIYPPQENGIVKAQVVILVPGSPEDVTLWMPYGMNSCPTVGSQVIVVAVFGNLEDKFAFPDNVDQAPILKLGETIIYNNFGSSVYLKENGDIDIVATNDVNITASNNMNISTENVVITATQTSTSGTIDSTGAVNTAAVYKVDGTQVVSNRGAAVPDAAGGATVDAEARVAINTLLARVRVHGLITT